MERKPHTARCITAVVCAGALALMPTTGTTWHTPASAASRTHAMIDESVTDDSYEALRIRSYEETVLALVCHESPECNDFKSFLGALSLLSHTTQHQGHDATHELPYVAFIDPVQAPQAAASLGTSGVPSLIVLRDGAPQDAVVPRLVGEDLRYAKKFNAFVAQARALDVPPTLKYDDRLERNVTPQNYDQIIAESHDRLVVLEFTRDHCADCVGLSKTLRQLVQEGDGSWLLAHVDEHSGQRLWESHRPTGFPALLAIRNGVEVERHLGYSGDQATYRKWIKQNLSGASSATYHYSNRFADQAGTEPGSSRSGLHEPHVTLPTPAGTVWRAGSLTLY